ncbi:nuclear transport factor 2 family protein [Pseudomonas sp.]|jgi:predicted SnoaL-like aldol condensation-catalyzing enzyme|uniref:nuclear transport factor 2 family protein n=1 Tax=Pseudomonas sp. TaxID=306 RepID=UPI002ED9480D
MNIEVKNKSIVLKAFDALFNQRDYDAAEAYWSADYVQHSALIPPGRQGLFDLIKSLPNTLTYEPSVIMAEDDKVMVHGRFSGNGSPTALIAVDIVRLENGILVEHWDVLQEEATTVSSASGLPMFGARFPESIE